MGYRFDWTVLWSHKDLFLNGLVGTVSIFLPAAIMSLLGGAVIGAARDSRHTWVRDWAGYYIHVFRNTPTILVLFFLYFAYRLDPYVAAVVGLTIHHSAYIAEVIQAGIRSSAQSLLSTALASGFTRWKAYYYVVIPVAFRIALPPLTTQMLELLKNTSIAMTISFVELTYSVSSVADETFRGFEAAAGGTLLYACLAIIVVAFMSFLEARLKVRV